MIALYATPVSTYAAKVALALEYKGLAYERHLPPGGSYRSAEYRAIVPTARVPMLMHDGHMLIESDVIIEYLEEIAPTPSLLPGNALAHAQARLVARFHDLYVEPLVRRLFPQIAPSRRDAAVVAEVQAALQTQFDALASLLRPGAFLAGDAFSIADCAWPATHANLLLMGQAFAWSLKLPDQFAVAARGWATMPAVSRVMIPYGRVLDDWFSAQQ